MNTLSETDIAKLVDRAAILEAEIASRVKELKVIKKQLQDYALEQPADNLKDEEREGRSVPIAGKTSRARVTICSDSLIASFKEGSPKHKELCALLADAEDATGKTSLRRFFDEPNTWNNRFDDGQSFRKAAADWLPEKVAPKFISACRQVDKSGIAKNKITVAFGAD